jgi:hypothetical protein
MPNKHSNKPSYRERQERQRKAQINMNQVHPEVNSKAVVDTLDLVPNAPPTFFPTACETSLKPSTSEDIICPSNDFIPLPLMKETLLPSIRSDPGALIPKCSIKRTARICSSAPSTKSLYAPVLSNQHLIHPTYARMGFGDVDWSRWSDDGCHAPQDV